MDLAAELQRIYESEINVRIGRFWDCGIEVRLGDDMNGFLAEEFVPSIAEVLPWLQEAIARFYPDSTYAKTLDPELRERAARRLFTPPRTGAMRAAFSSIRATRGEGAFRRGACTAYMVADDINEVARLKLAALDTRDSLHRLAARSQRQATILSFGRKPWRWLVRISRTHGDLLRITLADFSRASA